MTYTKQEVPELPLTLWQKILVYLEENRESHLSELMRGVKSRGSHGYTVLENMVNAGFIFERYGHGGRRFISITEHGDKIGRILSDALKRVHTTSQNSGDRNLQKTT